MSEAIAQSYGFSDISPREAANRSDLVTVDVRQTEELFGDLGHISGITHLPLNVLLNHGPAANWDANTPLLVVCRSGARSAHAATMLGAMGFSNVHNLSGGMMAWNSARLPVSRSREDVAAVSALLQGAR